jgi:hypothetical protein
MSPTFAFFLIVSVACCAELVTAQICESINKDCATPIESTVVSLRRGYMIVTILQTSMSILGLCQWTTLIWLEWFGRRG